MPALRRFFFALLLLLTGKFAFAAADASAVSPSVPSSASAAEPVSATAAKPSKYKNTYVIVHGAWGGGWAFKEVDELLTDRGNKIYRPTLTGQGEKVHLTSANISLTTHIDDIANVILWENLHDIVLVGHSYGGMVITGVADKVPDRIKKIIYLDAVLPQDGENFGTALSNGRGSRGLARANEAGYLPAARANLAKPIPHDVDMPAKPTTDPIALVNQDAVKKIPTTYILTVDRGRQAEQDQFYQAYLRAKARGWDMVVMEGDHNVQWSHPKELAELLEKATGNLTPPNPPAIEATPPEAASATAPVNSTSTSAAASAAPAPISPNP